MTGKNLLLWAFTGTMTELLRLSKIFFSILETQGYKQSQVVGQMT